MDELNSRLVTAEKTTMNWNMEVNKLSQLQHRKMKRWKHNRLRDVGKTVASIQSTREKNRENGGKKYWIENGLEFSKPDEKHGL